VSTFAETTGGTSGRSQTTHFTVLVCWVDNPVDASIVANDSVLWVDKDDFKVLVRSILVDPVTVQDTKIGADAADTFFSNTAKGTTHLKLVDTVVFWFTVHDTFVVLAFATTTTDGDTVHGVTLLGFVSKTASFVWAGRMSQLGDFVTLTVKRKKEI
jgi:hypothetical protein